MPKLKASPTRTTTPRPAPSVEGYSLVNVIRAGTGDPELHRPDQATRESRASDVILRSIVQPNSQPLHGGVYLPVGRDARSFTSSDFLASSIESLHRALRPALRLNELGAELLDLTGSREVLTVGVQAMAGGGYTLENEAIQESIATFSGCSLTPADAAVRMTLSRRLLRSGAAEVTIKDLIRRTLEATIEQGVIAGSGADGQPLGLLNSTALQQKTQAGARLTLTDAAEAIEQVLLADGDLDNVAFLMSAQDFSPLTASVFSGQNVIIPDAPSSYNLCGRPVHFSKFIPSGRWICADWSQLSIRYWGPPELLVDKFTMAARGTTALTLWQTVASGVANRDTFVIGKAP